MSRLQRPDEALVPQVVVELPIELRYEPNAPDAVLVSDDTGRAALAMRPHFDDVDQRTLVLRWSHCLAVIDGPYNDEARHHHPLYEVGLKQGHWIAEVRDSDWLELIRIAVAAVAFVGLKHYVLPMKERTIEVAARELTIARSDSEPPLAAVQAL